MSVPAILERLGIEPVNSGACADEWIENPVGSELESINPSDGKVIARVRMAAEEDYDEVAWRAAKVFREWRMLPAPKRGLILRDIGDELRRVKDELGALVSLEMGKILAEGRGEVQEMIDIADFAVGLSRQIYGLTMHSERPGHRMYEQWHPLGVVGVISAFNFPVAVWSWNAMIAAACGDCVLWKPSSETPLTAIAGFIETLLEGALDDRDTALRFLKTVKENTHRLSRLVDDLYQLSLSDLGALTYRKEEVDLAEALSRSLELVRPELSRKGLELEAELPSERKSVV